MTDSTCPYCSGTGGTLVWSDDRCRVVLIEDAPFTGLSRVAWNAHVRELSDLCEADRHHLMDVVAATEQALRDLLQPAKINLAALGTAMAHLHWHVIPRYTDDSHFPEPIWANAQRPVPARSLPADFAASLGRQLDSRLGPGHVLDGLAP